MAGDERDARLVLRAEDRATKTFEQVAKSIANVRVQLQEQAKAAEAGTGSLDDLKKSLQEIERAAADLEKQRSALNAFEKTSAGAELAAEKVKKATDAYTEYQNKIAGSEAVTDRQSDKLARLAGTVERTTVALNKSNARVDSARERLTGLGLSAENTQVQFDQIVGSFRELTPLLAQAEGAISNYDQGLLKAAAAAKDLAEEQTFLANSARTGITQEDIGFVTSFTQANALLREEEATRAREAAVNDKAEVARKAALQQAVREQLAGNAALEASFAELAREQREASSAAAFRKVASDAAAAAGDLNRFGQTATSAQAQLTRLADSVRSIVTPTLAEVQTLDGALKQIDASATTAADKQKLRTSQYQDSLNALTQAQAGLVRQAQNVDAYRAQETALRSLEADLGAAALKVQALARSLATVPANADEVARELAQAEKEMNALGTQAQTAGTKLEQFRIGLQRAGVDVDNLVSEEERLIVGARKAGDAAEILRKKTGGDGKGFLGLKSYELTNLGYQVNDVFTSLASGIPITQTLAQQGPQIAQLFPSILVGALKLLPILGPIAIGLGAVAYSLYQTKKAADAVKGFDAIFTLAGSSASMSAAQFGQAQIALENLGNKADVAKQALQTFVKEGLDPSTLDSFIKTADTIADVTGEALPAAAQKLADAYSKGYEQVVALNEVTGSLTDSQLDQIKALFDAGKATDARTLAEKGFSDAAQRTADKSKTEWTKAAEELGRAFGGINTALGFSQGASAIAEGAYNRIIFLVKQITEIADLAATALNKVQNGGAAANAALRTGFGTTGDYQKVLEANRVRAGLNPDGTAIVAKAVKPVAVKQDAKARTAGGQAVLDQQQTELKNAKILTAEERLRTAEVDARRKAEAAGASNAEVAQAALNARKIEQLKIDKENASAAKSATSTADKAARSAETRQSQINALTLDLRNTYLSFSTDVGDPFSKIQDDAEKAVNSIRDKFAKLKKLGITSIDGKSQQDFEKQVTAYAAVQTQQATLKKNEGDLNALLEDRKNKLAAIADQVARGALTPLAGIDASKKVIDETTPAIQALATKALEFAQNLYAAKPDPKLAASISEIQKALSAVSGPETQRALQQAGQSALKSSKDVLDDLVAQRDAYVRSQNQLVAIGLLSETEAQKRIKDVYDRTTPGILAQADAVQAVIDKLVALKAITPEQAGAAAAEIAKTRTETKLLDADIVALKQAALSALTNSVGGFITDIGTQIANVIRGTSSLKDALNGIASAALSFAASFTQAIAQAIVQLIALKIAKAALGAVFGAGVFHEGGIVGAGGGRARRLSPADFAGAIRYHTGGIAGLRPNEVPAVLQRGEEVLTREDPRHRANASGQAQSPTAAPAPIIKNINLFDVGEAVSQGANTVAGERAILNVIQRNPSAVKAAMGG